MCTEHIFIILEIYISVFVGYSMDRIRSTIKYTISGTIYFRPDHYRKLKFLCREHYREKSEKCFSSAELVYPHAQIKRTNISESLQTLQKPENLFSTPRQFQSYVIFQQAPLHH